MLELVITLAMKQRWDFRENYNERRFSKTTILILKTEPVLQTSFFPFIEICCDVIVPWIQTP